MAPSIRFHRFIVPLCFLVLAASLADLVGWWAHAPRLVGFFPEAATMKPNTAVCLALLASATLARLWQWNALARLLAAAALVIAGVSLVEYIIGRSLGIDQLIATVPLEKAGDPLGRMSRGTAVDGILSGLALLLLDDVPVLATLLCSVAGLLALSALVGFAFDAGPLLGIPFLRSMSFRTAISFAALQAVIFLLRPKREPLRSLLASTMHHRTGVGFLVVTCGLPFLLAVPIALLYRHGFFEASFGFALLVVLLMGAQTMLVAQSSRSIARVELQRLHAEEVRATLLEKNRQQDAIMRESERKATESDKQYRLITDALPALVAYIDRDFRYVRANQTYEVWFGFKAAEIEGRMVDEVLGDAADPVRTRLLQALNGIPQQFEAEFKTLQGKRFVSISHMPDADESGYVRGVIVQANDVTARRREEELLRRTEKLAAVGKLASSIAHEINNPLEAVTNLLYLAKGSYDLEESRQYLQAAEDELARVSAIASQTLRFHKQSTGPVECDAVQLLSGTLAIYRSRLAGKTRLEERYRGTLPICCHDGEARQVLNNLVGNALDAMPQGGVLKVRIQGAHSPTTGAQGVAFTVADTGSGMSRATVESIFEAFFTTKGMNGTGLGLWVSKEIIDRHNGTLRLKTSQGPRHHGTIFRLFLPCATPQPEAKA